MLLQLLPLTLACRTEDPVREAEEYVLALQEMPAEERVAPAPPPQIQTLQTVHPGSEQLARQWRVLIFPEGRIELHGPETRWYPDGQVEARRSYDRHRPVGTWEEFHPNGQMRSRTVLDEGGEEGESRWWHDDGSLAALGSLRRGLKEGPWEYWHPGGEVLHEQGLYQAGLREGHWLENWPDGELRAEGSYAAGRRVGQWRRGASASSQLRPGG